jgi:chromosome segregation ATPase
MIRRHCLVVLLITFATAAALHRAAAADPDLQDLSPQHPAVLRAKVQLDQARQRWERARKSLDQAQAMFHDMQEVLRSKTGRIDVSPASLQKAAARLEAELESLQLDAAGGAARMDALEKTIATEAARGQEKSKGDEVAAELTIVVSARENTLKRMEMLAQQATVSQEEVERARATLAEAKARLAERRMSVAAAAGGGALSDWNRELLNLSLDAQERRARTLFLKESIERLRSGLPHLDKLQEYQDALPTARQELVEARRALEETERDFAGLPAVETQPNVPSKPKP